MAHAPHHDIFHVHVELCSKAHGRPDAARRRDTENRLLVLERALLARLPTLGPRRQLPSHLHDLNKVLVLPGAVLSPVWIELDSANWWGRMGACIGDRCANEGRMRHAASPEQLMDERALP